MALGLNPENEKAWAILSPANIGLNLYQADLKIISSEKLDETRKKILEEVIIGSGGEIFFPKKELDFYLIKLPKEFSLMNSIFPTEDSNLSSHYFSSSNKVNRLWRNLITEIEMEWHRLKPHDLNINTLWAWGWGTMPVNQDCDTGFKKAIDEKKITVIPIIKDEGLGERKNDSNNDRINHMTFSMMSLANIYVVLGWYDNFDKKTNFRITNQIMEANYINKKIDEIFN